MKSEMLTKLQRVLVIWEAKKINQENIHQEKRNKLWKYIDISITAEQ